MFRLPSGLISPSFPGRPHRRILGALVGTALCMAALVGCGGSDTVLDGTLSVDGGAVDHVTVIVRDPSGDELGRSTSGGDAPGAWAVPVDGPGKYTVWLDPGTLPSGVQLADPGSNPPVVSVHGAGRHQVDFPLVSADG